MGDQPFTILVVDDSESTQAALTAALTKEGFTVMSAMDGPEALRCAVSEDVDLVLLDLGLPGAMDGLQVLRMVRATEACRHLPIVVLTVQEDRPTRLSALKLGADDFVRKPWDIDELLIRIQRFVETKRRIDDLMEESAELQKLSVTDGLTQLHNHRFFQERLREEFRRAQRYDDPLALVLVDLDHFKNVNDRHGHQAGDRVLRDVADCLSRSMRETDLLARYGGEEFAILLPKTHLAGSLTVAERIWKDIGAMALGDDRSLTVTASVGVSGFPSRSVVSAEQLFRTADEALYRAKRDGRNKICLFQARNLGSTDGGSVTG